MAEFAIILPLLALLLVMAVDFGRVFFGWIAIHNAARIGADFAAGNSGGWKNDDQDTKDRYELLVLSDLQALNCTLPTPDPVPDPVFTGFDDGDLVSVTLACDFGLITPLAGSIVGQPLGISAGAEFPVHQIINSNLPTPEPTPIPACGAPTADFDTNPAPSSGGRVNIADGEEVEFTDTSTAGSDCTVTSWTWNFGDGDNSTDQDTSHVFSYGGSGGHTNYTVVLTIQDSDGGTDDETITVRVSQP